VEVCQGAPQPANLVCARDAPHNPTAHVESAQLQSTQSSQLLKIIAVGGEQALRELPAGHCWMHREKAAWG
jgi:hypothetical protein